MWVVWDGVNVLSLSVETFALIGDERAHEDKWGDSEVLCTRASSGVSGASAVTTTASATTLTTAGDCGTVTCAWSTLSTKARMHLVRVHLPAFSGCTRLISFVSFDVLQSIATFGVAEVPK
jgi:hypothetical protein